MLIEQAFAGLPEFFCGPLYPPPENEANVAASLMLAVLQEVNGRNANHPLASIERERLYQAGGFPHGNGNQDPAYLRADLHVNYGRVGRGTVRLSAYGWRFNNWVEVKYFRNGSPQKAGSTFTDGTKRSGLLAADLVRLACLVPERPTEPSSKGRYLLHIYDQKPERYVSFKKLKGKGSPTTFTRTWLENLYKPGAWTLEDFKFGDEGKTFKDQVGSLSDLQLKLRVTNTLITPNGIEVAGKLYWLCLVRIDSVEASTPQRRFVVELDRKTKEDAVGDFEAIRQYVGTHIGVPGEETIAPALDLLEPPDDADVAAIAGDGDDPRP